MTNERRILYLFGALFLATPAYAYPSFAELVNGTIVRIVDVYIVPLLYALAFVFFIIGVVRYFFTGGEENRQTARVYILWSLIGMVVLFGVWGVVRALLALIPTS